MNDTMCGNPACGCQVSEDDMFCSEACSTAAAGDSVNGEGGCACPHADCQLGADIEPVVYADMGDTDTRD